MFSNFYLFNFNIDIRYYSVARTVLVIVGFSYLDPNKGTDVNDNCIKIKNFHPEHKPINVTCKF